MIRKLRNWIVFRSETEIQSARGRQKGTKVDSWVEIETGSSENRHQVVGRCIQPGALFGAKKKRGSDEIGAVSFIQASTNQTASFN